MFHTLHEGGQSNVRLQRNCKMLRQEGTYLGRTKYILPICHFEILVAIRRVSE